MYGGVGGRAGLALVLGLGILAGAAPAGAADLGGDCCADLEERIAELEATTARKGNRKVSLEISGHVNEAVLWWDDGKERNAYIVTNDNQRSRFRFKGKAKIDKDLEAGYQIEVGIRTANSKRVNQFNSVGNDNAVDVGLRSSRLLLVHQEQDLRPHFGRPAGDRHGPDYRDQPHADGIVLQVFRRRGYRSRLPAAFQERWAHRQWCRRHGSNGPYLAASDRRRRRPAG